MNIIDLKPVGQIILNERTPEREERFENYLIPYYQRGYRWDIENVTALLEDIHNFMNTPNEKKYCLQPIVVVPGRDEEGFNRWEVIDGQQRLITLNIIFNYLKRSRHKIIFEKRGKSTGFLQNLSPDTYDHSHPDFHFMSKAYETVKDWFDVKTKNDVGYIDDFNSTLTKRVEIIWYQIEELSTLANLNEIEEKKIDVFNRLNIGKIPLTDAELIRALLLSKIKFGLSDREAILRQAEISAEWHRMELSLRSEDFWYFLNDSALKDTSSTIEFVFKLIAEDSEKKYSTYMWFEKQIKSLTPEQERDNAIELWSTTKEYFGKLKFWFKNDDLYHHLGFLLAGKDNQHSAVRRIIEKSNQEKSKFKEWAYEQVKQEVKDIRLEELSYDTKPAELKKVFLLHNIIAANLDTSSQRNRFPFNLYKKTEANGGWSLEHIHAQQSKDMKESNAIKKWLEDTYEAIKDIKLISKYEKDETGSETLQTIALDQRLKDEILKLLSQKDIDIPSFNLLKSELIQTFDSESLHVLDNLALLSVRDNSSLNNAIFPVKRNRILEMERQGKFIPLVTRNVFLKYYSSTDLQPHYWSREDKKQYFNNIKETLKPYLN